MPQDRTISWNRLKEGFPFHGRRWPLVSPQGIFAPKGMGVRPDLVIEVRPDVLEEEDGPMLIHGIQQFHGKSAIAPRNPDLWPSPDFLEVLYREFRRTA